MGRAEKRNKKAAGNNPIQSNPKDVPGGANASYLAHFSSANGEVEREEAAEEEEEEEAEKKEGVRKRAVIPSFRRANCFRTFALRLRSSSSVIGLDWIGLDWISESNHIEEKQQTRIRPRE